MTIYCASALSVCASVLIKSGLHEYNTGGDIVNGDKLSKSVATVRMCVISIIVFFLLCFSDSSILFWLSSLYYLILPQFIYSFIYWFIYLFIYSFIRLFIHLFIHLFIYLSIYLFIHLFIHPIISSFICTFLYIFICRLIFVVLTYFFYRLFQRTLWRCFYCSSLLWLCGHWSLSHG